MANTLKPARILPPIRPIPGRIMGPANSGHGRPSVNLGHILNGRFSPTAALHSVVGMSNPMPFTVINPETNHGSNHYGNRVTTALNALTRNGSVGGNPAYKIPVAWGHRVTNAIRQLTRG